MDIIPTIFSFTKSDFLLQLNSIQDFVDLIQIDIADGLFVKTNTWANADIIKNTAKCQLELHLMVKNYELELLKWQNFNLIKRILIHVETLKNFSKLKKICLKNNWQLGLVLNPQTPINKIKPYINKLDSVMFMGVMPGAQGQKLIPEVLKKITNFNKIYSQIYTELDGGIKEFNLKQIQKTGLKAICLGSALFKNDSPPSQNLLKFKKLIN